MVKRLISSFFEIISVKDGEKGEDGSNIYPQDVWSPEVSYLANQYFRPFVMYRENENQEYEYYLLITDEPCKGINPKEDATVNGGHWKHIPNYQAIYAQIIFAEFAKLGSAIMFGDYLMSQYGTNTITGNQDTNYKDFPSSFTPNLLIDLKTGNITANNAHIKGSFSDNFKRLGFAEDFNLNDGLNWYGLFDYTDDNVLYLPNTLNFSGATVKIYSPPGTRSTSGPIIKIKENESFQNSRKSYESMQDRGAYLDIENSSVKSIELYSNSFCLIYSLPYPYIDQGGKEVIKVGWWFQIM